MLTAGEGNLENCHPEKKDNLMSNEAMGVNFSMLPLVQSIIIKLYWMLIKYIVYITLGFKTIEFEFVFRTQ